MFFNYLKIALRGIARQKFYSSVNLAGLAVGMACAVFVALYATNEFSYDDFHENGERIYRVNYQENKSGGSTFYTSSTMAPLAPALKAEVPGLERVARFRFSGKTLVRHEDKQFFEQNFAWADAEFLQMFSFPLLSGHAATALSEPNAIVITKEMAEKYFGEFDPVGEVLQIDNTHQLKITGVLQNLPQNSSINFDFLGAFQTLEANAGWRESWGSLFLRTFVELSPGVLENDVAPHLKRIFDERAPNHHASAAMLLQPLSEIHLFGADRSPRMLLILYNLIFVGVVILTIAIINYMNMATARSVHRSKEVGLRKTVGASRLKLARQFLGESVVLALLALPLSLLLVQIFLPIINDFFSQVTRRPFALEFSFEPVILLSLFAIVFFVGVIGGSYPAMVLSRFKPVAVLQSRISGGKKGARFRKILVVTQFAFSMLFLISTAIIHDQIDYLRQKDLGFEKDRIVTLHIEDKNALERAPALKTALLGHHNITHATLCQDEPARLFGQSSRVIPEGAAPEDNWTMHVFAVDADYVETFGLEMKQGRNFITGSSADENTGMILNETAVARLGWENPIGKMIQVSGSENVSEVIGVVRDFHFQSMTDQIEPGFLYVGPESYSKLSLRLNPKDFTATMDFIRQAWTEFAPNLPFEMRFFDEQAERLFARHELMFTFSRAFSFFAIFIACLGLFGLAAFMAEQRTKEIGVRKVLGATAHGIVSLLSFNFLKLILIAFVIAAPLAWISTKFWLENFPYRADLGAAPFVVAGVGTLLIAFITISYQALKAALANPIDAIRHE